MSIVSQMLGSWPHGLLQDAALVALEALQNEPDETLLVNLRKMQSLRGMYVTKSILTTLLQNSNPTGFGM